MRTREKIERLISLYKIKHNHVYFIFLEVNKFIFTLDKESRKEASDFLCSIIDYCYFYGLSRNAEYNLRNCTMYEFKRHLLYALEKEDDRYILDILMGQWEYFRPSKYKYKRGYDFYNEFRKIIENDEKRYINVANTCMKFFENYDNNIKMFKLVKMQ